MGSALLSGNPKIRNREPERNRKPESGIHQAKKTSSANTMYVENYCAKLLPLKIRERQVKESSNKNFLSVEICATFFSSEGLRILGPVYMEEGCPG